MGCWNETCNLSHLQICYGDKVKLLLLYEIKTNTHTCYYNDNYASLCLPMEGEYDDYGGVENVKVTDYTLKFLSNLKLLSKIDDNKFESYEFKDVETLISHINSNDNIYLEYGCTLDNKFKLTYAFYHEELYDILVEDFKKRKPYKKKQTIYELYLNKLSKIKDGLLNIFELEKILSENPNNKDVLLDLSLLKFDLNDKMIKTCQYGFSFPRQYSLLKILNKDNIDDFHKNLIDYIMFAKSLEFGRYSFFSTSGRGGQDLDVRVQELIARFIIKFIKREFDEGGKVYTKNETIFWSEND